MCWPYANEGKAGDRNGRGSSTVNGNVPPRRVPNAVRRPREYLTAEEVARLIAAALKRSAATPIATRP